MIGLIGEIIGGVVSIGKDMLDNKKEKIKGDHQVSMAEKERKAKALTHEADWDKVQAENSNGSWKDEWLTILVSIPLILSFIPAAIPYVEQGFKALAAMPTWYQGLVGVVFAASFGVKKLSDLIKK